MRKVCTPFLRQTIEETAAQDGLIFSIATNSGVGFPVSETLPGIGKYLEQCARKGNIAANQLFVC